MKWSLLTIILALTTVQSPAAIILSTDFDTATPGVIGAAGLTALTTGGSWVLNTTRGGSYSLAGDDPGDDLALLLDDSSLAANQNVGLIEFGRLNLDAPASFAAPNSAVIFDFLTAVRRVGANKGLRYDFYSSTGTRVARINWFNAGGVFINGNSAGSSPFTFLNPWDETAGAVRSVSLEFVNGQLNYAFGGLLGTEPVENGQTDVARMVVYSLGSSSGNRGVWLADLSVAVIPESGTIWLSAALLLGIGAFGYRRRLQHRDGHQTDWRT